MEQDTPTQAGANEPKAKRIVERSAAYPAITIEDAIGFVVDIYKNFRYSFAKRDDITSLIEGSGSRHVAAASHYGFLNREKDTYQVVESTHKVLTNPVDLTEKVIALLSAFQKPTLNKELIEKFDGAELPKELTAHLTRFHRITSDAAPLAAEVFIKNAKYCGVLDTNNVLNFKTTWIQVQNPNFQFAEVITEEKNVNHAAGIETLASTLGGNKSYVANENPLLPEMVNEEKIKVRLTGKKFAYLIYPDNLNQTDIEILRKQIEQLELMIK